jgi:hypothetical protein
MSNEKSPVVQGFLTSGRTADDSTVVLTSFRAGFCPSDDAGSVPRIDRLPLRRRVRELDLLELFEGQSFDRQDEPLHGCIVGAGRGRNLIS